jgi:hypothetical protein
LTQEQKASLEALVKGINGYQASFDGATDTGQAQDEASQQYPQAIASSPVPSSLTPEQVADAVALLSELEEQQRASEPSMSSIGSQAGQSASEASWTVPAESSIQETGYATSTTPETQRFLLATRLHALQEQEQDLLRRIQRADLLTGLRDGHRFQKGTGEAPEEGLHRLSSADLDALTKMILEERLKHATPTTTLEMGDEPVVSSGGGGGGAAAAAAQRRGQAHYLKPVSQADANEEKEEKTAVAMRLLALGGFDPAKLAAALSQSQPQSVLTSASSRTAQMDEQRIVALLLQGR